MIPKSKGSYCLQMGLFLQESRIDSGGLLKALLLVNLLYSSDRFLM